MNSKRVSRAILIDERSDIYVEGIVAVLPFASLLTVDIDNRLSHCAVKVEDCTLTVLTHRERGTVPSSTNPRQRARTTSLLRCLLLAILYDSHSLLVYFLVEWSADSPVVWHIYHLPLAVIVTHG